MPDKDSELRVVRQGRDGRRRYDEKSKLALVEAALQPGVSVARVAQDHGINANLLRKWITKYLLEREKGVSPAERALVADDCDTPPAAEVIDGVAIELPGPRKVEPPTGASSVFVPVVSVPPALHLEGGPSARAPVPSSPSMTLALHVRLSNGVEFDISDATIDELATVVQMLGRMPCSGSTRI
ncbi:transposase [Paraburkholderia fungorum]|uniref:transposase n=1 Tax=Paraburkholderia fungorum TaxID=134537 RepID=UPI0011830973